MYQKMISSCRLLFALACLCLTCLSPAAQAQGGIQVWGTNQNGELGNGAAGTDSMLPVNAGAGSTYVTISAGPDGHSLALDASGNVWGWGANDQGQLGTAANPAPAPVAITGLTGKFIAISAGYGYSLAVDSTGAVWAWGNNDSGQLGTGTTTATATPTMIAGMTGITAVSAGYYHSMALTSTGAIVTWGDNTYGELGNNTTTASLTPIQLSIPGSPVFTAISASAAGHSLAMTSTGSIYAWGYDQDGECGDGQSTNNLLMPTKIVIAGNPVFTAISAGASGFSMALDNTGAVWTWGDNSASELGVAGNVNTSVPAKVAGVARAVSISAGYYHSAVATDDGCVWSWGYDASGQLGDQLTAENAVPTEAIASMGPTVYVSGVTMVSAGSGYTEVLTPTASPIKSVILQYSTVRSGATLKGIVVLNSAVTNCSLTVALSNSAPNGATIPATLTIPNGKSIGTFTIATHATSDTNVMISAQFGTVAPASSASVFVVAPVMVSLTLKPTIVIKANSTVLTVTLDIPAPLGGMNIPLMVTGSGAGNVTMGGQITVLAGSKVGTLTIPTTSPANPTAVAVITATLNMATKRAILGMMK
jgi:alpha-tubulin suppressor-like RCC1 family protein